MAVGVLQIVRGGRVACVRLTLLGNLRFRFLARKLFLRGHWPSPFRGPIKPISSHLTNAPAQPSCYYRWILSNLVSLNTLEATPPHRTPALLWGRVPVVETPFGIGIALAFIESMPTIVSIFMLIFFTQYFYYSETFTFSNV